MTVVTSIYHVFRLGLGVLVPALVLIALPVLLLRWQRHSRTRVARWVTESDDDVALLAMRLPTSAIPQQ
jgi:hypothetical protein